MQAKIEKELKETKLPMRFKYFERQAAKAEEFFFGKVQFFSSICGLQRITQNLSWRTSVWPWKTRRSRPNFACGHTVKMGLAIPDYVTHCFTLSCC